MKINDDHLYHGAALTQVAEHPSFKAINAFSLNGSRSRSAFLINHDIGLYLKYASEPKGTYNEFRFNFLQEHVDELAIVRKKTDKVFIGLICISVRQICCLSYRKFLSMIEARRKRKGADEASYTILLTLSKGQRFRAYMSPPGKKKTKMGERIIPRDDFPSVIFP